MTAERRVADRKDLDDMTRDFLDKGGTIVKCPPGASENVVYKRGSFKRRAAGPGSSNGVGNGADNSPAGGPDGRTPTDSPPAAAPESPREG